MCFKRPASRSKCSMKLFSVLRAHIDTDVMLAPVIQSTASCLSLGSLEQGALDPFPSGWRLALFQAKRPSSCVLAPECGANDERAARMQGCDCVCGCSWLAAGPLVALLTALGVNGRRTSMVKPETTRRGKGSKPAAKGAESEPCSSIWEVDLAF